MNCESERRPNVGKPCRPLTDEEKKALASYEKKCALVRDKVRAAVSGTKLGALIHGEGGIGLYQGVTLSPEQCFDVLDFYLAHVPEKRHHDLRILEHGFWDRIDESNHVLKETTWREQFLAEILKGEDPPVTRRVRIRNEREVAQELYALYGEKKISHAEMRRRWEELTGHASMDSLYRRLRGR
jgi:hypothetical protein